MKVFLSVCLLASLVLAEDIVLKTQKGNVRGKRVDGDTGNYYYSFRGIRYAQAPTGKLRFKDPVEVAPYTEEYDATDDGLNCPQWMVGAGEVMGDEDCLNLNVYTPKVDKKKRAVMVYIHGGAFITGGGSSTTFGPTFLLENDVVVVSMNYRLGALGFMATADKAISGNMGIKDQTMALKWVKENIANFGGDPTKVTIFGDDAGGASVSIHMMSEESNGLFANAIVNGGNVLGDIFFQTNPQEAAVELASRLDCTSEKGEDILRCLSTQTQQAIVGKQNEMATFFSFPRWWAPTVDGKVLTDTPLNLLTQGKFAKVPLMVGQTKDAGAFYYRLTLNTFNGGNYDDNFVDHKLPRMLPVISSFNTKLYPITRQVRKRYFVNVDLEDEDEFRPRYNEFLTDMMFTRSTDKLATLVASHGVPVYAFSFDYRGQHSIINLQGEQVDMGVGHGDDLQYMFDSVYGPDYALSKSDRKFSKNVFVPLLTNFAKTSIPTPSLTDAIKATWEPLTPTKNQIYRITDNPSMDAEHKLDTLKFWHEDIPKLFTKKQKVAKKKEEL